MGLIQGAKRSLCILAITLVAGMAPLSAEMTFVHPGALNTRASLDFVKAQVAAEEQPWKSAFDAVRNSVVTSRVPHATAYIDSTADDANVSRDDAHAAYALALLWYLTGNPEYAERSVTILNAWSHLQGFSAGTEQDRLQAGWIGSVFAQAAEIMRIYPGWAESEILAFQDMFRRAFYPQLNTASFWNGNVDLTQIDAMISIAVFNDDEQLFNSALARLERRNPSYFYLSSEGARPPAIEGDGNDVEDFWSNPARWIDGLTQETCRDNGHHAQFALGSALHVAEVAWNQGVDVYSPNRARYTAAMELMAGQLLSGKVDTCRDTVATATRLSGWETGYRHYHQRMGMDLPNTHKLIMQQIRTQNLPPDWNIAYETLTHVSKQ